LAENYVRNKGKITSVKEGHEEEEQLPLSTRFQRKDKIDVQKPSWA